MALSFSETDHLCNSGRGYQEEQFCETILNSDKWFRRRCHLKDFLSGALTAVVSSGGESLCNFGKGHNEEPTCEVILNLDLWFKRRCRLKKKFTDRQTQEDRSQQLTSSCVMTWWILFSDMGSNTSIDLYQ